MSEIKKILEEQLEREKASAKKDLNMQSWGSMSVRLSICVQEPGWWSV